MFTCETEDHAELGTQSPLGSPSLSYSQEVSVDTGYISNINKSVSFSHEPISPATAIGVQQHNDMDSCSSTYDQNALHTNSGYCVDMTDSGCHVGIHTIALHSSTAVHTKMLKTSK